MFIVLLGVLVILWAVLIGSWLKDRASTRTGDSVSAFRDQLHTLQRTQPGGRRSALRPSRPESFAPVAAFGPGRPAVRVPAASARARQRRRDVLVGLLGLAAVTFLLALVVGGPVLLTINVLCDLALFAYVAALLQQQRIAQEKHAKVRYLPSQAAAPAARRPAARPVAGASRPGRVAAGRTVEPALLRRTAN